MRRVSSSDASSGMNSHLCGLTTIESARSQPANASRRSGMSATGPAYAASTCSQRPSRSAISAIASTGSIAVEDVVPIVATMAIGRRPAARSSAIARLRGRRRPSRSRVGRDPDQRRAPETERHARLLDRAVGLLGGVHARRRDVRGRPARGRGVEARRLPRRGERDERRRRRRIGDAGRRTPRAGPSAWRSQSTTTPSSSVPTGEVRHSIAFWPSAAVSSSPRIPGPEALVAKYAKKPGCCQCVRLGTIRRSTSARIASSGSPCSGGRPGTAGR